MPPPEITIALQTDKSLSAYGPLAETVEGYGFDGLTVYNDMLYQPAWLPLLEIARHTRRVRLGPAAVNPFTCHPINIAGQMALIDEVSAGRAYLGLARGSWLDFVGLKPERPIQALSEAFGAIRHLLRQDTAPYPADIFPAGRLYSEDLAAPDIALGAPGTITAPDREGHGFVPNPDRLAAHAVSMA